MKAFRFIISTILFILLIFTGCKKETYRMENLETDKLDLSPGLEIPVVAKGNVSINDILPTNDTLKTEGDSIVLVLTQTDLYSTGVSEILELDDEDIGISIDSSFSMGVRTMPDEQIEDTISLNDLKEENSTIKTLVEGAEATNSPFPELGTSGGDHAYNATKFKYISFESGRLVLSVENTLPADISYLELTVTDDSIFTKTLTFRSLTENTTKKDSFSLSGETMTNNITLTIDSITTTNGHQFDTENNEYYIHGIMDIKNVQVNSGAVKISDIPEFEGQTIEQNISIPDKPDLQLDTLALKSGTIDYSFTNKIDLNVDVTVEFPQTEPKGGGSPIKEPIQINTNSNVNDQINLSNTITDLTKGGTGHNIFTVTYNIEVEDPGDRYVEFDKDDSVKYNLSVSNFEFDYIKGYFGQDEIAIDPQTTDFNTGDMAILDQFQGSFQLTNPSIKIHYTNSFGLPIELSLNVNADDKSKKKSVSVNQLLTQPSIGEEKSGEIAIDSSNGLDELLTFPPPDKITYFGNASINPDGDQNANNFITSESQISIDSLNVEIPMEMKSDSIVMQDTLGPLDGIPDPKQFNIQIFEAHFAFENEFPFNMIINAIPYDPATDSLYNQAVLLSDTLLKMPNLSESGKNTYITESPALYNVAVELDTASISTLRKAKHLIIKARLDTKDKNGETKAIKLLSTYSVGFKMGFETKVHLKEIPSGDESSENSN